MSYRLGIQTSPVRTGGKLAEKVVPEVVSGVITGISVALALRWLGKGK